MRLRKLIALAMAAVVTCVLVGCSERSQPRRASVTPVLGFLVGHAGECSVGADRIQAQADALVANGFRDAGYRTLVVACDGPVPAVDDQTLKERLAAEQMTVVRVAVDDERADHAIPAGAPPHVVRSQMTRHVMLAWPLVFSGDARAVPAGNLPLIGNRAVTDLALDDRAKPGAPVAGDPTVYSRAVGTSGLLVSLSNSGGGSSRRSVSITDLNLAGDDTVPATDAWTGRRVTAVDGRMTADLARGDSALLRIGCRYRDDVPGAGALQ